MKQPWSLTSRDPIPVLCLTFKTDSSTGKPLQSPSIKRLCHSGGKMRRKIFKRMRLRRSWHTVWIVLFDCRETLAGTSKYSHGCMLVIPSRCRWPADLRVEGRLRLRQLWLARYWHHTCTAGFVMQVGGMTHNDYITLLLAWLWTHEPWPGAMVCSAEFILHLSKLRIIMVIQLLCFK